MNRKILVYQELLPQIPELGGILRELGAEIYVVIGGQDALENAHKQKPVASVLATDMPAPNGLVCCERLKQHHPDQHVILVESEASVQGAVAAWQTSCDLFAFKQNAQGLIASYLLPLLKNFTEVSDYKAMLTSKARTYAGRGFVHFTKDGQRKQGGIINVHSSGVQLAVAQEIPIETELCLDLCSPLGKRIHLPKGKVKAVAQAKSYEGFSWAIDFMPLELDESSREVLEDWSGCLRAWGSGVVDEQPKPSVSQPNQDRPVRRASPRVVVHITAKCLIGDTMHQGIVIRLNRGGFLMATPQAATPGTQAQVTLSFPGFPDFHAKVEVVRTVGLKNPHFGLSNALGAKFVEFPPETMNILDAIAELLTPSMERIPVPEPEFVRRVMEAEVEEMSSWVLQGRVDSRIRFLEGLSEFEQSAFSQDTSFYACVRRLVILRGKWGVFSDFVPKIRLEAKTYGEPFLLLLGNLIAVSDLTDNDVDEQTRAVVAAGDEVLRQGLILVSNQLDSVRIDTLCRVAEGVSSSGLGQGAKVLEDVVGRVTQLRAMRQASSETVKYARREAPKPKKDKRKAEPAFYTKRSFKVSAVLTLIFGVGITAWIFLSQRVPVTTFEVSLPLAKAVKQDEGLLLFCKKADWLALDQETQTGFFETIETYLAKNYMIQMKLLDESNRVIAVIAGGRSGRKILYSRRVMLR